MSTTSSLGSSTSNKVSDYSRSFELPDDISREHGGVVGGAMLPVFLNDLRRNSENDLVEVTLELDDDDSIVLCSVTSTSAVGGVGDEIAPPPVPPSPPANSFLARSSSAASRLSRKFSWFRSPALSRASSDVGADHQFPTTTSVVLERREELKMKAKLMRTKSSAQRALRGLRFINKTTNDSSDGCDLWKIVESRFNALSKDGLLSREDFGECIGNNLIN